MSDQKKQVSISVVAPFYNEEKGGVVAAFFDAIIPVLEKETKDWEIICVDDGSKDATYSQLKDFATREPRIKLVKFSRNFGKEIAVSAGLKYVSKNCVIPMDADLQDPPALIPEMIAEWKKGAMSVLAKRRKRNENAIKQFFYRRFYNLMKIFSDIEIPSNTGDYRLVDIRLVHEFNKLPERQRYVRGLWAWVGFPQKFIYFERPDRELGEPGLTYRKLFKLAGNAIFTFSTMPLKIWGVIGFLIAGVAFVFGAIIIGKTLILGRDVPGYASMMVAILFFGGIQLLSIGIIGEYLGRVYEEVKGRPLFIAEELVNIDDKEDA